LTASACISGMITKPPPYARAPTLNATHTRASTPPVAAAPAVASGHRCPLIPSTRLRACHATSTTPQPTSTRTSHGPTAPAPAPPRPAQTPQRQRAAARRQLSGTSPTPARTATAATAAPAPAPAPRTQSGGDPARNRADSARMATSPGTMKAAPPTIAPNGPPTRQAQKIASCVEAGPGNRLQAATASSNSCAVSQPSRSTHSSRSRAMGAGGPPKPVEPMRPHCTATSARRDGGATQLFRRGGDGSARSRAGEPGHNRSERLVLVVPECDIGDAPFLTSLDEQITALVDGPHQRDPRLAPLGGAEAEGGGGRSREAPPVVADGGEEVTNLELDVGEAIASGFAHPVELLRPWSRQGLAGLIGRDL